LRTDSRARYVLSTAAVASADGSEERYYSIVNTEDGTVRVLDLKASPSNLTPELGGDLGGAAVDRDLRFAFRLQFVDEDETATLQRVTLGDQPTCSKGDTNCDGTVRVAVLGDSYISGEGAADGISDGVEAPSEPDMRYHSCTDMPFDDCQAVPAGSGDSQTTWDRNRCHRSDASWAMRAGRELVTDSQHLLFAACSGAITDDLIDHGQYDGQDGRRGPSPNGIFGGQLQADALADFQESGPVDVVFLSIGGNDVKFADVVKRCMLYACLVWPTSGWKGDAQRDVYEIEERVVTALRDIELAAPTAQVVIAGYPDPTGLEHCGATGLDAGVGALSIDEPEQQWLRSEFIGPLNSAIEAAAERMNASFLPFQTAFAGHEICSDVAYAHGLKAGNDAPDRFLGPIGTESFHPNAYGHRKLFKDAKRLIIDTSEFGSEASWEAPMIQVAPPLPQPSLKITVSSGADPQTLQATPDADLLLQGAGAPPNGNGVIFFNSLPTKVGTWQADADGNWSANVTVPESAAPGLHRLIATDPDTGDEIVSAETYVNTGATCPPEAGAPDRDGDAMPDSCDPTTTDGPLADHDGDGTANEQDNCPALANPTQADDEANGIGDACDPAHGSNLEYAAIGGAQPPPPSDPTPDPVPDPYPYPDPNLAPAGGPIFGTAGPDVIHGTWADDVIYGLGGNDTIYGNGGNDLIIGGSGNDKLFGIDGNDTLRGGPGTDKCVGGAGTDKAKKCEKVRSVP
jgi:lysophospholipase L1-like esterase